MLCGVQVARRCLREGSHSSFLSWRSWVSLLLRRSFGFKGSVDHGAWARWPLSDAQRAYAAADACVVADLVVAIAEREAEGG